MMVPNLRFSGFESNWEEKTIEDFFDVGSSKRVLEEDWTDTGVPFYRTRELVSLSKNEPFKNEIFISEELFSELSEKYGLPTEGDFLVSGVGTLGISYQVKKGDRFYFKDGNVLWFKLKDGIASNFFKYCFQSEIIQKQIFGQAAISTVGTYTIQNAKKTKFFSPKDITEQQKIASCLSSLDDLITAHTQKLDALKAHKKGLMQQLFPAEGEKTPKLRFEEFKDNWTKKRLSDLIDLQSGYAFQSEYFSNRGSKLVTPKNFTKEGDGNFTDENTKFTTEEVDSKYLCKAGDLLLLLTDLTPTCELLGRPLLLKIEDGAVLLNQRIAKIVPKESIEIPFLHSFFSTDIFHKRITDTATGSTVRHSSNSTVLNTELLVPSKEEQQKIATCFSSLDKIIKEQTEKIEQLKRHKKGLMQGLFPNIITQ